MRALLTDKSLFKIFLTMLSFKCTDAKDILSKEGKNRSRAASFGQVKSSAKPVQSATTFQNRMAKKQLHHGQQTQQQQHPQRHPASIPHRNPQIGANRKRALSTSSGDDFNLSTPKKSLKMMRSPMQQGKEFNKTPVSTGPTLPVLGSQGQGQAQVQISLDINFSVLSAIVFYSVFQYLEQWPAVFIRL